MIHLNSSKNLAPRVLSKSIAGISAVAAAAALMFSAESAHAGATEYKALVAALSALPANPNQQSVTVENATPDQIAQALTNATSGNAKLKVGVVAGEALKLPASVTDATGTVGQKVADAALARPNIVPVLLATDAAKTAGTSKGASVIRVPDFVAGVLSSDTDAITAASKAGPAAAVGAVIGGRASELANDAARVTFATDALKNKTVAKAVTQVSQFVAESVSDTALFARQLSDLNIKNSVKIAPGVVAADPENAYNITNALLDDTALSGVVVKGAAGLAKSVAAVADIEQISLIASALSDTFNAPPTDAKGKPLAKISSLPAIAKTLTQAITSKPNPTNLTKLSGVNKADEIGEVAAYIVGGIINNAAFTAKAAPALVLNIMKNAIAGAKTSKKTASLAPNTSFYADVAGSVARTLAAGLAPTSDVLTALKTYFANDKNVKKIAGSGNLQAIKDALELGFSDSAAAANAGYEDGTRRNNTQLAALVDPETDNKTF